MTEHQRAFERPAGAACYAKISFAEAHAILRAQALPLGTEDVPLVKAGRRTLAEPVIATISSPRFDAAAMDGFAVCDDDISARPCRLPVLGAAYPGNPFEGEAYCGAVRIMTGAPLPNGADYVIPREFVLEGDGFVILPATLPTKSNVRRHGSDFQAGQAVLQAGRVIDPRAMVVAAAADVSNVKAWIRPRVFVIASGDELAAPGMARSGEQGLPDSLSEAVQLMVRQWGGLPVGVKRVQDDAEAIARAAAEALAGCDILVMAGGASRGDRDFARSALAGIGTTSLFEEVSIKPGKPVWYGKAGVVHVLGLPGNPTAAMTIARLFMAPLLTGMAGRGFDAALKWRPRALAGSIASAGSREEFLCGAHADGEGVRLIESQSASAQAMLADADLLVHRLPAAGALEAGELVNTLTF